MMSILGKGNNGAFGIRMISGKMCHNVISCEELAAGPTLFYIIGNFYGFSRIFDEKVCFACIFRQHGLLQ